MGKKSQAKKALIDLYNWSIEEFAGACEIVDIVWGEGTGDRWIQKYNKERAEREVKAKREIVSTGTDSDPIEIHWVAPGWVEHQTPEGHVYKVWRDDYEWTLS